MDGGVARQASRQASRDNSKPLSGQLNEVGDACKRSTGGLDPPPAILDELSIEMSAIQTQSLRSSLKYEARILKFGTSGRRGKVIDLAQLEVYLIDDLTPEKSG